MTPRVESAWFQLFESVLLSRHWYPIYTNIDLCPYTACCGNKRDITLLMREAVTGAAAIKLTLTHRTKPEVATTAVVRLYLPPFPPPPLPPPPRWGSAG